MYSNDKLKAKHPACFCLMAVISLSFFFFCLVAILSSKQNDFVTIMQEDTDLLSTSVSTFSPFQGTRIILVTILHESTLSQLQVMYDFIQ